MAYKAFLKEWPLICFSVLIYSLITRTTQRCQHTNNATLLPQRNKSHVSIVSAKVRLGASTVGWGCRCKGSTPTDCCQWLKCRDTNPLSHASEHPSVEQQQVSDSCHLCVVSLVPDFRVSLCKKEHVIGVMSEKVHFSQSYTIAWVRNQ